MQRKLGAIVAAIGMVLTIIVNLVNLEELLGWPIAYWNVVFMVLVLGGFLAVYFSIEEVRKEIEQKVYEQVRKDIEVLNMKGNEAVKGRIEDISPGDTDLIVLMDIEMGWKHGHGDFTGLFADRASGVPLNELMERNCSQCGIKRNEKSKK